MKTKTALFVIGWLLILLGTAASGICAIAYQVNGQYGSSILCLIMSVLGFSVLIWIRSQRSSLICMDSIPEQVRKAMTMELGEQVAITLFPEDQGQPRVDVLRLDLTEIEGRKLSIFMTPCEALEICAGLNAAVQMYLYNQDQYREEVLIPRQEIAKKRAKGRTFHETPPAQCLHDWELVGEGCGIGTYKCKKCGAYAYDD